MAKIRYGVSNLYIGAYEGPNSLGVGVHIPGTVAISLEPNSEMLQMYADNGVYWSGYSSAGFTGEIEGALFPNSFLVEFLGYEELSFGAVAKVAGNNHKLAWMAFQSDGDTKQRVILYNVNLGSLNREYATTEDTAEPQTAKLPFSCYGDDDTKIVVAAFNEGEGDYSTLFTSPPTPDDLAHYALQDEDGIDLQTNDGDVILARVDAKDLLFIQDQEDPYSTNNL